MGCWHHRFASTRRRLDARTARWRCPGGLTQEIEGDHGDVSRKALESALESPSPPPTSNPDDLLRALGESGVVAIIRAKNAKALARAIELVNPGCAALEVTRIAPTSRGCFPASSRLSEIDASLAWAP